MKPLGRLFDKVNRYRIAAGFLLIPFVITLLTVMTDVPLDLVLPPLARRAFYWGGIFFLTLALGMDQWEIARGKREVKRLIAQKLREK